MTAPDISLQLYTVRDALAADLDGTIARLAEIGFRDVEAFDFVGRAPEIKAALDRHGMVARTGHGFLASSEITLPDGTAVPLPARAETFAAARELGMEIVIDPFVGADRWQTREGIEAIAADLADAAHEAAAYGLTVGYHNHDHELLPVVEGRTALELFAEIADPRIRLEVDLYWATAAGVDVPALLETLGDRVVAVHVKDGPMAGGRSTTEPPLDQTPAGRGDVPLEAALAAAPSARFAIVEFDAVEFDAVEGDVFDAIAASRTWLDSHLAAEDAR